MSAIASQITSLTIVYSIVYPGTDQGKHQSSASLAFVWGIPRRPVNSPHKGPVVSIWWRHHGFYSVLLRLTHRGRVTPICVDNLDHHWFWSWIVTCSAPSLYLNQYCFRQSYPWKHNLMKLEYFHSRKCIWKCPLPNGSNFVSASICWDIRI